MKILYVTTPKLDYLAATLVEGLNLLGHSLATTTPHNGGSLVLGESEAFEFGKTCDLIIEGSNVAVNRQLVRKLDRIKQTIYVDGSDFCFPEREGSAFSFGDYPLVFKREMQLGLQYPTNYKPLLFAALASQARYVPFQQKTEFCTSTLQTELNPHRASLVQQFSADNSEHLVQQLPKLPLESYCDALADSYVSVSQRGWGWDTLRFWQIVGCGTVVASDKVNLQFPHPYTTDVNFIEWDNWEDLKEKLQYYKKHLDRLEQMTNASMEHTKTYHTSVKRAEQFLQEVAKI